MTKSLPKIVTVKIDSDNKLGMLQFVRIVTVKYFFDKHSFVLRNH